MIKKILALIVFCLLIFGIYYFFNLKKEENFVQDKQKETEEQIILNRIKEKVSTMTLEEKIGQMLIIGLSGTELDARTKEMIEEYGVGGFNLLGRNIENRVQSKKLISDMQSIAKIPLFIATDQEGGNVIRFDFFEELTRQVDIKSREQAKNVAEKRGEELLSVGVNMNFAPVLDYVTDKKSYLYDRTFGASPELIGDFGNAMIDGYISSGVIPVVKHFPGYGNISLDPHKKGVSISISKEELEQNLFPFREIIKENPLVPIMTAHIIVPIIDEKPATLSAKFLSEILRGEMGFEGVIITDDMEMASVGKDVAKESVEAVKAGADMIISTYTSKLHTDIFLALRWAVLSGEISQDRIDESVVRILRLKENLK